MPLQVGTYRLQNVRNKLTGCRLSWHLPKGARILSVNTLGNGDVELLALIEQRCGWASKNFLLVKNWDLIEEEPATLRYIGNVQLYEDELPLHLFEIITNEDSLTQ